MVRTAIVRGVTFSEEMVVVCLYVRVKQFARKTLRTSLLLRSASDRRAEGVMTRRTLTWCRELWWISAHASGLVVRRVTYSEGRSAGVCME